MPDHPSEPFGSQTIEGAFLTDVEYGFESDTPVTVEADSGDEHEIEMCNVDLKRNQIGTQQFAGSVHPVLEILYKLTVPVGLAVRSGDDVTVDGFESTWTFTDVDVVQANQNEVTVLTERIERSYGDTTPPDYDNA